jgi:hypothetical protein
MLNHFIKPEYLISLLERRAFHLLRQDCQSDPADGLLPASTFDQPFQGSVEEILGLKRSFLQSQARAVAALRTRTFIMSWAISPSASVRARYGERGQRCELQVSTINLKRMIGYEWIREDEFPPRSIPIAEVAGAIATAQLKSPHYTGGASAIPVVPSYFATAHKNKQRYSEENEVRIEVVILPENGCLRPSDTLIRWPIASFVGLRILLTEQTPRDAATRLYALAAGLNVPVG